MLYNVDYTNISGDPKIEMVTYADSEQLLSYGLSYGVE